MKYQLIGFALVILLIPLVMGCQITPEDKWPLITHWETTANFDVTLKLGEALGIPQLTIPDRTIGLTIDVQSFNANQGFDVTIFLERIDRGYTVYNQAMMPGDSFQQSLPITEIFHEGPVFGTYLSGNSPQGVTELVMTVYPDYFPLSISDWIDYETNPDTGALEGINSVTDRFIYLFRVVVKDQGGRSDSFTFDVYSNLKIETKKK